MSLSLGAAVKTVFTPALVKMRFIWGATSGMYPIHAKGLYSSSCSDSFLKGSSLKRLTIVCSGSLGLGGRRLSFVFCLLVLWSGGT